MLWVMRGFGILALVIVAISCDGVDHENIDTWRETEKGPGKLKKALGSSDYDADMRAHAAQALLQIGEYAPVKEAFAEMPEGERTAVVAKLAPRLTRDAQAPEGQAPGRLHNAAKDGLFELRGFADDATRTAIDEFLADWLGVNYEDRTRRGRIRGEQIVRHVGKKIASKLLSRARTIIATPPDAKGRIPKFTDDLLRGLAFTGDSSAVELLLDMAMKDHPEPTLRRRSMAALYVAYVEDLEQPEGPKVDRSVLKLHAERFLEVIRDGSQEGRNVNEAFALLAASGQPECEKPLLSLITEPDDAAAFLWTSVQKGLICVGAAGVATIVEAMPTVRTYQRGILEKYLWNKMLELEPTSDVVKGCRAMLQSESWVARVTAVECLGRAGSKRDAPAVQALAGDKAKLEGWWGDQREVQEKDRKKPIALGAVAQEVAKKLKNM